MKKNDLEKKYTFDFDEQETNSVSEQIMDSYNTGYINQEDSAIRNDVLGTEG